MSRPVQSFHREVLVSRDPQDRRGHDHRDRPVQLCIFGDTPAEPGRRWLIETVVTDQSLQPRPPHDHVATRSFDLDSAALPAALT